MVSQLVLRCLAPLVLGICMGLAACAGAPVQEMSNARQAIKAARDAASSSLSTPPSLAEAEALLNRAEASLQKRAYKEARRDAIAARGKAVEALSSSRSAHENNGGAS
jgi:hypothetical protein